MTIIIKEKRTEPSAQWEISDDNGTIYNGNQKEIQLIWDLLFRDVGDIANEYREKYSNSEIRRMKDKYKDLIWSGSIKLIEIHHRIYGKRREKTKFQI